jgi:hypothetical protein
VILSMPILRPMASEDPNLPGQSHDGYNAPSRPRIANREPV